MRIKPKEVKTLFVYVLFLLIGIGANFISSNFIMRNYPERPLVPDLLFDITPYYSWTQHVSDPLVIISIVFFTAFLYKKLNFAYLKEIVLSYALIHYMRALIIPLTPLGRYHTNNEPYGIFQVVQTGMFTSGHTAAAFLLYLLVPQKQTLLKKIMLTFFILQVVVLILSRGHYSIDIIGGMMVAYISLDLTNKHLSKPA